MADEISTRPAADCDSVPASEILVRGRPTGRIVAGAILEAAARCGDRYLLFLTDDVPFEDALSIQLLDRDLNPLDSAVLGGPYATGSFAGLELRGANTLRFRFIGNTDWMVEILPRPAFRLPFLSDSPGVHRRAGFRSYFIVRGSPRPEA